MSIEILELSQSWSGLNCFSCTSKKGVSGLCFRRDGRTAGYTVLLCAECRAELAIELAKSLVGEEFNAPLCELVLKRIVELERELGELVEGVESE